MLQIEAIGDLGIVPAPLQVLIPDNQTTRFQLFQCSGELDLNDRVQNSDRGEAILKHLAYLASARGKNSAIALTPEYSCPWEVVEALVSDQKYQPKIGSLLILGCESIMPEELASLRERTDENIRWHSETLAPTGNQLFYSAAVYIFHLHDSTEEDVKLCGLIQFKTHDMGGTTFERDNLIKGSVVYKLSNPGAQASINLLTFICADTFNFRLDDLEEYLPYLIVHLQLNASPHDAAFTQYRNLIFSSPKRTETEIIVLNWAAGTSLGGHIFKPHNGSMYFMQGDKLEKEPCQKNTTINNNHRLGVHLRFSASYKHSAYAFSCGESTCNFDTTKVSQRSPGAHCNRSGIQTVVRCLWNAGVNKWVETDSINDGITSEYDKITGDKSVSYLEREALITLSTGNISEGLVEKKIPSELSNKAKDQAKPEFWHKPRALESFYLEINDRPKGTMALLDDKQEAVIGDSLASLSNILAYMADTANLPEVFSDCDSQSIKICLNPKELKDGIISHNLTSGKGDSWGTVVELGNAVEREARKKFDEIKSTTKSSRLVVWYRNEGELRHISDNIPSFTNGDGDPRDITG